MGLRVLMLSWLIVGNVLGQSLSHPFLITRTDSLPVLRQRATQSPWRQMKASAQTIYAQTAYDSTRDVMAQGYALRDITGASALLYILDPDRQAEYKRVLLQTVDHWDGYLATLKKGIGAAGNKWGYKVPPSSAFFNSVLALDLLYPDLTEAERQHAERRLAPVASWFRESTSSWDLADYGVRALWSVYTNDTARQATDLRQYRERLFSYFSPDGVYLDGTEYPHGRLGGERTAKFGFMHVAECSGTDPHYYDSPVLQRFYEWLYTFTLNPFNQIVTFGDAGHGRYFDSLLPVSAPFGATNFSRRAGALVAHRLTLPHHPPPPGDLLSYCITRQPPPSPIIPTSQYWRDGGAVFWENNPAPDALMGAHRHRDVNSLYIAGYGETLLVNSGYNGYGNGYGGFNFNYLRNNSSASNTVTIDGQNHADVAGEGVVEALLNPDFNYVSAQAKRAFGGTATHDRHLMFIPPQDGQNGYFALLDVVTTAQCGAVINVNWHPMATVAQAGLGPGHYTWAIQRRKRTPTYLTVFLGTEPDAGASLRPGALAGWGESVVGEALQANYRADTTSPKAIITVLFPHDSQHAEARFARLTDPAYTGVAVDLSPTIRDVVLASSANKAVRVGSVMMQATSAVYRLRAGRLLFYFVRQGTHFSTSRGKPAGFRSAKPISLFLKNGRGSLLSPGTMVTFFAPGLQQIRLTNTVVRAQKAGSVTVFVPPGEQSIQLR
ncbi:heparinase II/III family protein [uncultured Fibrella sp.]|uniref:heparinase II/III domain-containing protein n=1 Tax=uncultured Fibrella sp. TaxID=1284596 RepID=UPI0035CA0FEE